MYSCSGCGQLAPRPYQVTFLQTAPAATGGGVLGNEDRMTAIRCLFAVVGDQRWRQAFGDEVAGILDHGRQALVLQILPV
jgi:hypothetical protein